ncbi:MAG: radical SAM family heme chaperone HemW [Clostridia bacterium]|nr:radical SAM family heme chaperone HemW [Clostridia bacterium]
MVHLPEDSLGIYVHVPYCIKKCRYCDFVSFEKAPQDEYFDGIVEDIRTAANKIGNRSKYYVDTLFFGGGTPSLANAAQLGIVLDALRKNFEMRDPEMTVEVNPETVTAEKAADLKALGFNRISMGVQSLDDEVLKAMGRVHDAEKAKLAFRILREAGFDNINLDLIFGAPAQDLRIWQETLAEVLKMRPEHISFYSLQLEEGTPLYADYTAGKVDLSSWEENRAMYHAAVEALNAAGYHHYEISNAALPGFECRHNLKYWNMQPYLGFGLSAHSFINGCRGEVDYSAADVSDPAVCQECGPDDLSERPVRGIFGLQPESGSDLKGDFIFTKLRLTDGFELSDYSGMFGSDFRSDFAAVLPELLKDSMLELTGDVLRFTQKGLDNTNPVMGRLIEALEKPGL